MALNQDFLANLPADRENDHLGLKQLKTLLAKLLQEKERLLNRGQQSELYTIDKDELSDPVDEASVNMQTSQELRFRTREGMLVKKIHKALEKLQNGTYGLCTECDAKIRYERLEARPVAELCILCKEEAEMGERQTMVRGSAVNSRGASSLSLSK